MRDTMAIKSKLAGRDWALAAIAGLASFAAFAFLSVPGLDPSQWGEVAVAARLRPPQYIFPGLWRVLTCGLFAAMGISRAVGTLAWIGAAVGGLCVALTYLVVRQVLAFLTRFVEEHAVWTDVICPMFAFVAAFLMAAAEPLWDVAQTFSPEEFRALLLLLSMHLYLRWLSCGGDFRLYSIVVLVGVLAAETPFAFALPPLFIMGYFKLWNHVAAGSYTPPNALPDPDELPKWRMFFLSIGVLGAAVWLNTWMFKALGGITANGWREIDVYFRYVAGYWRVLSRSSTMAGWALGLGFGVFPLLVAQRLFPSAVYDDRPMQFQRGATLVFVCALAAMHAGALPAPGFWHMVKDAVMVPSGFLLVFYDFCSALTIALVGAPFAFECQRVYLPDGAKRPGPLLRGLVPAIAVAMMAFAAAKAPRTAEREMQRIVRDALDETVRECGDAKWIFTDGHLDEGLELVAATRGKTLYAMNMMSGPSRWEESVRVRGLPAGGADRDNAMIGVPALLRVWAGEKPDGMKDSAVQVGLDFWRREGKEMPTASGFLARVSGMDAAEAERGIEAANAIASRIVSLSEAARIKASPALDEALSYVAWRISRFARLRKDDALADKLDQCNTALKRMLSIVEYERQRTFMQMTPREGLKLALARADFIEARRYAAAVLRSDEEDPEANFGMGMSYLREGRMENAEFYLRRCLIRRPDEPAVLNNLSIICRKARRYEEAEELARHALRMLPDSPEVRQTLKDALEKKP